MKSIVEVELAVGIMTCFCYKKNAREIITAKKNLN